MRSLKANGYFRDSCMRNNVQSLVSITRGKAALWAHNYHIGRDDTVVNNPFYRNMLGQQLHDIYGDRYYPVGLLFDEGGFLAQEAVTDKGKTSIPWFHAFYYPSVKTNRLTRRLSSLSAGIFFIDISTSPNPVWQKAHRVYMAGGTYHRKGSTSLYLNPSAVFDGIIFVRKVSAIEQLDDSIRPTR